MQERMEALAAPFPQQLVKQRKGSQGKTLDYVEASTVVQRLNEALQGDWSFTVVRTDVEIEEVIIHGRLKIGDTIREQFGGSKVTRHRDSGEIVNLADDMKAATSDALKKCASMAGVGLYLYSDAAQASPSNGNGAGHPGNGKGANGNNRSTNGFRSREQPQNRSSSDGSRISNQQIAQIFQSAKEIGISQKDVITLANNTFNCAISQLTPEQADDLISMVQTA